MILQAGRLEKNAGFYRISMRISVEEASRVSKVIDRIVEKTSSDTEKSVTTHQSSFIVACSDWCYFLCAIKNLSLKNYRSDILSLTTNCQLAGDGRSRIRVFVVARQDERLYEVNTVSARKQHSLLSMENVLDVCGDWIGGVDGRAAKKIEINKFVVHASAKISVCIHTCTRSSYTYNRAPMTAQVIAKKKWLCNLSVLALSF